MEKSYFLGGKLEDILGKFDGIMANTPEDLTFIVQVRTNNIGQTMGHQTKL